MDWRPSPLEPNLKFASGLKEDLKTKYFEQHEKANKALEEFSCSLQNVFLKHQQLLNENIELSVTNEKLRKIVDSQESNQQIAAIIEPPSSEILGASPNCKLRNLSNPSGINKKDNWENKSSSIVQKENINDFPPIYSEDFISDEDESFIRHKSPPASVVNSPVKVQSSPILSKRKRSSSKKSNSSTNTSSQSIDSYNDSKVSLVNASSFDKNIDIDYDLSKEFDKEYEHEPLKPIENILQSPLPSNRDKNSANKILNVSKTNFAKTDISEKGKKSRQTILSFKKETPVIDISRVDCDESFGNTSKSIIKRGNSWSETFYDKSMTNQNSDSILTNMKKLNSPRNGFKESRTSSNPNTFAREAECIDISPIQNGKPSKLRHKLSLTKKSDISNVKEKVSKPLVEKLALSATNNNNNNNILQQKSSSKNLATNEPVTRSISDETYFSPAELTNHKTDMTNVEVDLDEFEDDEMQCDTPPAKKILLDSFDIIPGREEKIPDYAYKEGPVRKKSDKEKLPGWSCRDCELYYGHLPLKERKKRQNMCSRHRGNYKPDPNNTNDSFWWPLIKDDTHDASMFND